MAEIENPIIVVTTTLLPPDLTLVKRRPRKVYGGMWGQAEIGVIAVSVMALLASILLYVFAVVPSDREVARNRADADRLEAEAAFAKTKYGEISSTETQVNRLLTSADDFETRFLPAATNGRAALYQRINGLIGAYGLTNTTGPDYLPLDTADQNKPDQTEKESGREKFRSLFPGVYVTMTVEGPYQNLRRFIRQIETGNEFIIVSSVELAPSDTEQKTNEPGDLPQITVTRPQPNQQPAIMGTDSFRNGPNAGLTNPASQNGVQQRKPQGKTHGEVVALRLEMAAYFRRPEFSPMAPPVVKQ